MPRPSRHLDRSLLASGAALYPQCGCAGLSVRAVAAHAGTSPGMFHYHFESKDAFLAEVLQRFYDEMFERLEAGAAPAADPLQRLRQALLTLAGVARDHAPLLRRALADAEAGQPVAVDFLRRNMPRHVGLLLGLLADAERAGRIAPLPPLLRLSFLLGSVVAPALVVSTLRDRGLLPPGAEALAPAQVLSDEAIALRAELALRALTTGDLHG